GGTLASGEAVFAPIVRVLTTGKDTAEKNTVLFRADEMDLALETAAKVASVQGKTMTVEGHVDCAAPHLLAFDPSEEAFGRLRHELSRFAAQGFGLKNHTTANIRQWCDAMDAFKAHREGETDFAPVAGLIDS